jgi:hypothetical protein
LIQTFDKLASRRPRNRDIVVEHRHADYDDEDDDSGRGSSPKPDWKAIADLVSARQKFHRKIL